MVRKRVEGSRPTNLDQYEFYRERRSLTEHTGGKLTTDREDKVRNQNVKKGLAYRGKIGKETALLGASWITSIIILRVPTWGISIER